MGLAHFFKKTGVEDSLVNLNDFDGICDNLQSDDLPHRVRHHRNEMPALLDRLLEEDDRPTGQLRRQRFVIINVVILGDVISRLVFGLKI